MKSMLQEQARGQPITPGQEALESWTGGPCETVEEFGKLENVLKSVEKRQQLIRLLSSVGGKNSSRKCEKNDAEGDECLPHVEVQPQRTDKAEFRTKNWSKAHCQLVLSKV
ncbi:hypothetical protein DPMN_070047 [Dreissena polymorpha]|uniref:Uncharacterized protein n=1 Tax=Dreissena polymorpha TaxID=45954 RepID=A0A9D3Z4D7_DREPO|nr:hypothetical protein DPMN_070047 [Dreissena polymorpha]